MEIAKKYKSQEVEAKWQKYWQEQQTYKWDESLPREQCFVIDTPPPTVSGLLHMGHIYSYTQADFIARYQRMKGKTVCYPMGFDDNGLPTERLVEKVKKIRGGQLERSDFVSLCKEVVVEAEEQFRELFKSVALSIDWNLEYQTISDDTRKISQMSFLDLFHKNETYRKLQPTYWDVIDQTALSQADIEDKEHDSFMNYINFTTEDGEPITIATTRPELIPACVAIFAHPDDKRYQKYFGKNALTPLFDIKIPIIADDIVDQEKGSGLVMCCTFGDITDIEWWKKHKLPTRVIINKVGRLISAEELSAEITLNEKGQKSYAELAGLKIKQARERIIELIETENLLIKKEPISHAVKCAERSGSPLEFLVTPQWFIKVVDHKKALLEKSKECNWYPKSMKIRLDQWIEGLSWDWCISRQRYFGVPFPVWYSKRSGEEGKILTPTIEQLPIDPLKDLPAGYSADEVSAETDVMDTWATSSVSPQIVSGAVNKEYAVDYEKHQKLFPADLRPQAHEIIRSWAFYTIVKAHLHENTIPWKNLMISGWCLASDKTKMSKSKGNVVTPVHLIEQHGADSVRFWTSTSNLGADTAYSEDVLAIGKKLTNKLWNAAKFASLNLDKLAQKPQNVKEDVAAGIIFHPSDLWILSRLQQVINEADKQLAVFEYAKAREAIEDFFWNDFCDNYLEIAKTRSYGDAEIINAHLKLSAEEIQKNQQSSLLTLHHSLNTILKLFAPFVPHITEELYSIIFANEFAVNGSIHARGTWPKIEDFICDENSLKQGEALVNLLDNVRKIKSDHNVSIKKPIKLTLPETHGLKPAMVDELAFVTSAVQVSTGTEVECEFIEEDAVDI
jgi:valyl-tRNA synthetase